MGSPANCPEQQGSQSSSSSEQARIAKELGSAELGIQHLRRINEDIESLPWRLRLAPAHLVVPKHTYSYAKRNWQAIEADHAKWSKPLTHARVVDLCDLMDGMNGASQQCRDAWEKYHYHWATVLAAVAIDEAGRKPRAEPFSRRTVFAAMGAERQRAITAFKRLKTRTARGTGKRRRAPSTEAQATTAWEKANPALASVLSAVALTNEHIPYLAQQMGVSVEAYLETLKLAVDALTLVKSKQLNGSQQVPREKVKIKPTFVDQVLSVSAFQTTTKQERTLN